MDWIAMMYVYFLRSEVDNKLYIGCTSREPKIRLLEHNSGRVKSTKRRRPFKLIYFEEFNSMQEALSREWYLKHPKGYQEKLRIIDNL